MRILEIVDLPRPETAPVATYCTGTHCGYCDDGDGDGDKPPAP
jgi:hypothetical protein